MTEEMKAAVGRVGAGVAVPAVLAGAGLTGFAYQLGRATGWTHHFGVHYGIADVRQSLVPFATIVLLAATLVFLVIASLRTAYALTAPGAILILAPATLVVPPYGAEVLGLRLAGVAMLWLAALAARRLWRYLTRVARRHAIEDRLTRVERIMEPIWSRYDRIPMPTRALAVAVLSAGLLYGAWWLGGVDGRFQAGSKTEFDVLRRDGATATVIFTRTDDIVERTLDVSPGPDGKPRNEWRPEIVVRPMPDSGISFEIVTLGRTKRASPSIP